MFPPNDFPLKESRDQQSWKNLGKSFSITRINRPHFDVFGKEIEFDFSPKRWMLTLMRHFRLLRALLPMWHFQERKIAKDIRQRLLSGIGNKVDGLGWLKELDQINGYREIRYEKAKVLL